MIFWKQNFHQNLFFTNQFHIKIWCVVKFFFEIWHVLRFSIRNLSSCKKMALSLMRLKFLIQNVARCTKNNSKTDYFQKIQILFFRIKTVFSATIFPRLHKKASIDVYTVYIDQLNHSLKASFPENPGFLKTVYLSNSNAW